MRLDPSAGYDPGWPDRIDRPALVLALGMQTRYQEIPVHQHRKAQLVFAEHGTMTLQTHNGFWVVPPQGAVWIPGGLAHSLRSGGPVREPLRKQTAARQTDASSGFVAFFAPDAVPALPASCCVMAVSPFLRALLARTAALPVPYPLHDTQMRLMQVLLDELAAAPQEPFYLPMPQDVRLRQLAQHLLNGPATRATLAQWAQRVGMSERNLSRRFAVETGLPLHRWRQQLHVLTALPPLAQGQTVQQVADALGYDSASAFVAMFRKHVGLPPRRFLQERLPASVHPPHRGRPSTDRA